MRQCPDGLPRTRTCIRHPSPRGPRGTNRWLITGLAIGLALLQQAEPAKAHPHVFVDSTIGLVVDDAGRLEALTVTWRFDTFHTLYILSFDGITPTREGGLTPAAQAELARAYTDWQRGFDGFTRLTVEGEAIPLNKPTGIAAALSDARLEISFTRTLPAPLSLKTVTAEIAAYDPYYYHAVSVVQAPKIAGGTADCDTSLIPFDPGSQPASIQGWLAQLSREALPSVDDIGANFSDRIVLKCA